MARIAKLERAYRENPETPLFAWVADSYLQQGSASKAQTICEEGCERFPDYPTGFAVLSKCFEALDKFEDARMAMDRSLRLDPDNPGGYFRLSLIYEALGISTLALKSMQKAAALDPFNESLSEQLEELAAAVDQDPTQLDDQELAPRETAPNSGVTALEPLPDIDLEGAAQSGMQDYPEELDISFQAEAVSHPETYDPLITMATDVVPSSAADQDTSLEFALTSLDLGAGDSATDSAPEPPPDLFLDTAMSEEDIGDGTIPADEETTAADSYVDLGIDTLTTDEADGGPPNTEALVDLGAAIFGDADDGDFAEYDVEDGLAMNDPNGTEAALPAAAMEEGDVDLITFSEDELTSEPMPDLGAAELVSIGTDPPAESAEVEEVDQVEERAPSPANEPVSETSPADAVELISFEHEPAPASPSPESSGAVELISFDDDEWDDPQPGSGVTDQGEPATEATLFEFEAQDVVAAARSGPQGNANVVDLFQEIEGHPDNAEEDAGIGGPDPSADEGSGATETLAKIYASQGLIQRAIDTYRQLLQREPDNERLHQQLAELEQSLEDTA